MFDPVVANTVEFNPSSKSAFAAYDAVIANDDVTALDAVVENDDEIALLAQLLVPSNDPVTPCVTFNDPLTTTPLCDTRSDPVITADPLNGNPAPAPAFNAYDDVIAFCAQLLVPVNCPVNDPLNEPVLIWVELDTSPVGLFAMLFHVLAAPDT